MDKTKIRALILDYGGVISLPQISKNVENILQALHLEYDDFIRVYYDLRGPCDVGQISVEEFWINFLREFKLESRSDVIPYLIQEDIESWTELNDAVLQFASEIRNKVFKLAIISNMPIDVLEYIKEKSEWFGLFDELVFSCDVGVSKPDTEIYKIGLRKLNIPAGDCLFVDDSPDNVSSAMEVGMHAILFDTFSDFFRQFKNKYSLVSM